MKNKLKILVLFLCISLLSFKPKLDTSENIIGFWVPTKDTLYKRVQGFQEGLSGFQFKESGVLIVRQNSGWCGTPPIEYVNTSGTWKTLNESTIKIQYSYWGGKVNTKIEIEELSDNTIRLNYIKRK